MPWRALGRPGAGKSEEEKKKKGKAARFFARIQRLSPRFFAGRLRHRDARRENAGFEAFRGRKKKKEKKKNKKRVVRSPGVETPVIRKKAAGGS